MIKFWPPRPEVEGFSIEKLTQKEGDKMAKTKAIDANGSVQVSTHLEEEKISSGKKKNEVDCFRELSLLDKHWANRHYDEYRTAA